MQTFTVLIIEDDPSVAELLSAMLRSDVCQAQGTLFEPIIAEDLSQAKEILISERTDIILLDLPLPNIAGLKALKYLKNITAIPIIIVISYDVPGLSYSSFEIGAVDVLTKPEITPPVLCKSIIYSLEKDIIANKKFVIEQAVEDVTELRRTQKALEDSEEKHRLLVEASGEGIAVIVENKFCFVNKRLCDMVDYTKEEVIGADLEDFVHSDYYEYIREQHQKRMQGKLADARYRVDVITKRGDIRTMSVFATTIEWEGSLASLTFINDITESQQTMERRKLLVDILKLLNAPYSGMDTIKRLLEMIQNFTAIEAIALRLKDGEDYPYFVYEGFDSSFIEKENFLCVYQEESDCPVLDEQGIPILECMCGCVIRGRVDKSSPFVTENGSFWTNSTTKLLHNKGKLKDTRNRCNVEGYESVAIIPLSVGNEIIGSLQLNDKREDIFSNCMIEFLEELAISIAVAVKRAWQEDRIKVMDVAKAMDLLESSRQLNAGIAHELRTPLQAILNSLELIDIFVQDPCPTDSCPRECECPIINDIRSMSKEGIDRADYAINVLNSLSIYSKVATSEKKHLINLFPELTAIIKTLGYTDKFKGMPRDSISLSIKEGSCLIEMNKMDFELLMSNLLRNAREAINHSEPKIEIFAEHHSSNIILHVIDNGSGIDPSQGNKIFDPYFTTKGNHQEVIQGGNIDESNQGLGLAMVRTIIQAHGGTITYNSVPGRTEFIVTLPCVEKKEVEV